MKGSVTDQVHNCPSWPHQGLNRWASGLRFCIRNIHLNLHNIGSVDFSSVGRIEDVQNSTSFQDIHVAAPPPPSNQSFCREPDNLGYTSRRELSQRRCPASSAFSAFSSNPRYCLLSVCVACVGSQMLRSEDLSVRLEEGVWQVTLNSISEKHKQ